MNDERALTAWNWAKIIFLIIISGAGSFALADLIFPFNEGQNAPKL